MPKTLTCATATAVHAEFAETEFLHDEADDDFNGFAPTQLLVIERRPSRVAANAWLIGDDASLGADQSVPASWSTIRWVEEQEAKAADAARLARVRAEQAAKAAMAARGALAAASAGAAAATARLPARRGWFARLEDALDRLLPGNLGSLLQLFICVSLSMALISAILPVVDKI